MQSKVTEMFGARVFWLLDPEAPSETIEGILTTFGRPASVVDTLMLLYPYVAREKVARDLLDTMKKQQKLAAPQYTCKAPRCSTFDDVVAKFNPDVTAVYERQRRARWEEGVREILTDNRDRPSDTYMQARLRLFFEFIYGYVPMPHAFTVRITPHPRRELNLGVELTDMVEVVMFADPAGPSLVVYSGPF